MPVRVLLVEDSATDALLLREMLSEVSGSEYAITHVERVADARQQLAGGRFDVVLVDLGLPDASGLQALSGLGPATLQTPVIVLTGTDDDAIGTAALHLGAQDFVRKHELQPALISRTIAYAIERQTKRRELRENEDRLTGIIHSAMDGILSVDEQLRIILVNPAAEQMFGRPAQAPE